MYICILIIKIVVMKIYKKIIEIHYKKERFGFGIKKEPDRTVTTIHYLFGIAVWETSTKYISLDGV